MMISIRIQITAFFAFYFQRFFQSNGFLGRGLRISLSLLLCDTENVWQKGFAFKVFVVFSFFKSYDAELPFALSIDANLLIQRLTSNASCESK